MPSKPISQSDSYISQYLTSHILNLSKLTNNKSPDEIEEVPALKLKLVFFELIHVAVLGPAIIDITPPFPDPPVWLVTLVEDESHRGSKIFFLEKWEKFFNDFKLVVLLDESILFLPVDSYLFIY